LDEVVKVSSDDAIEMAGRLATEKGLFCGISSGAAVKAAVEVTIFFTNYNFVHDTMKDKVPREHWDKPIVFAFSRAIALAWGIALLVMTAAALVSNEIRESRTSTALASLTSCATTSLASPRCSLLPWHSISSSESTSAALPP